MLRSFAGLKFKTEFLSNVASAPVSAKTACWKEVCFVQIARNGLVTVVESIKVRLILTWHAQRWSKSRAAKHSPYFARLMEAEMAAARHKVEDSDSEEEEKHGKKVFKGRLPLRGHQEAAMHSASQLLTGTAFVCSYILILSPVISTIVLLSVTLQNLPSEHFRMDFLQLEKQMS